MPISIVNWQEVSKEMKLKLNESWLLKFNQVKQMKESSTENSAEKYFIEYSKYNEHCNIPRKLKRKQKYSNSKNFGSPDTLSDKFQQIALKFATFYLFLSLSVLFRLHKIPFEKLYCPCYLFESVSELESCRTYRLNLPLHTKAS